MIRLLKFFVYNNENEISMTKIGAITVSITSILLISEIIPPEAVNWIKIIKIIDVIGGLFVTNGIRNALGKKV